MEKARRNCNWTQNKMARAPMALLMAPTCVHVCVCVHVHVRVCACVCARVCMHTPLGREGEGGCEGDCSHGDRLHCWLRDGFSLTVPGRQSNKERGKATSLESRAEQETGLRRKR